MSDFKQKFLDGINTMGFDPDTQRTLRDAVNGEDAFYILECIKIGVTEFDTAVSLSVKVTLRNSVKTSL